MGLGLGIGLHLGGSKCERSTFSWRSTLRGWRCTPIHSRAELNWPLAVRTNALNGCSAAAAPAKLTPLGPAGEVAASGGGRGGGAQVARPPTASSDKGTPPSMLEMLDRREPGEEPATEGGGIARMRDATARDVSAAVAGTCRQRGKQADGAVVPMSIVRIGTPVINNKQFTTNTTSKQQGLQPPPARAAASSRRVTRA